MPLQINKIKFKTDRLTDKSKNIPLVEDPDSTSFSSKDDIACESPLKMFQTNQPPFMHQRDNIRLEVIA